MDNFITCDNEFGTPAKPNECYLCLCEIEYGAELCSGCADDLSAELILDFDE